MDRNQLIDSSSQSHETSIYESVDGGPAEERSESRRNFPAVTIEPVIAIVFLAQCLSDSVLTELFLKRTCEVSLNFNQTFCDTLGTNESREAENLVQPHAAQYLMWKMILQSIIPALWSFFLGPWTDIHGRKPVMIASLAGVCLMYCTYTVLAYIPGLPPAYILLGVLPISSLGGYVNLIATAYCYSSDVSTPEKRSLRLAVLEGSVFVGVIVGLIASAPLYKAGNLYHGYGFLAIFFTCALLTFLAEIYLILVVPETIADTQPQRAIRDLINLSLPVSIWKACFKKRHGYRRAIILLCMPPLAGCILILEGESQVFYLYTRFLFQWSLADYTRFSVAVMGTTITGIILGVWLLPRIVKVSDLVLASASFTLNVIQSVMIALITKPSLLYAASVVGTFRGLVAPCVRSVVSKAVSAEDLGKVFAMASVVEAISPFIASPMYVGVYKASISRDTNQWPGEFFLLSAGVNALSLVCLMAIGVIIYRYNKNLSHASLNNDTQHGDDEPLDVQPDSIST